MSTGVEPGKLCCRECGEFFKKDELLIADSPFDPHRMIAACPRCKEIETYVSICDEPGCMKPSPLSYRMTCGEHSQ